INVAYSKNSYIFMYFCVMERTLYTKLKEWTARQSRKPLIIRGARHVGKTWLMRAFGAAEYNAVAYINMESSPLMKQLFSTDVDVNHILTGLRNETGVRIDTGSLLICEEIQEIPETVTTLKYFQENATEYQCYCAG